MLNRTLGRMLQVMAVPTVLAMTLGSAHADTVATVRVASGLRFPVGATSPPGDNDRLFIVRKPGVIEILDLNTLLINGTPFLDIDPLVGGGTSTNNEQGLLGLAFHPDYANNGLFYVNHTANSDAQGHEDTVIAEYSVSGNPDIADPGSRRIVLTFDQPFSNHNGGWIGFGPNDGYLYIATGDGGSGNDPGNRAQDITAQLLGKLLRIDVDGGVPYAIPADNPFVGVSGDDEIWAYGLRNPWRCSFDRANGDLYIGDVGQNAWEEIDYQAASSAGGENYGWRCMEGNHCTGLSGCTCDINCDNGLLECPIREHPHSCGTGGFSITGGYVYRGPEVPSLNGHYFYGDYVCGNLWSFTYDGNSVSNFTNRRPQMSPSIGGFTLNQISSFGEDGDGSLYIIDQGNGADGQVFKMISVTETICPDDPNDFFRQFGGPVSGDALDLCASDDTRLEVRQIAQVSPLLPFIQLEYWAHATVTGAKVTELNYTIECHVSALVAGGQNPDTLRTFIRDYTSSFTMIDQRATSANTDEVITHQETTNAANFVQAGDGEVRVRQQVWNPGLVISPNWFLKVDQFEVGVNE